MNRKRYLAVAGAYVVAEGSTIDVQRALDARLHLTAVRVFEITECEVVMRGQQPAPTFYVNDDEEPEVEGYDYDG